MYLRSLLLRNFRGYEEAYFEFSPHINVIYGANAQGKTTLLEAIYLLITGHSFRTQQLEELIQGGASSFFVEASFVKHQVAQVLKFAYDGKERQIFHNHTRCQSPTALIGLLMGGLMVPDDSAIVKGTPTIRRHFLDTQIAQIDPLYVHHTTRYHRAMRCRNHLLRIKNMTTIESWEHEMANAAAYLTQQRSIALRDLEYLSASSYIELAQQPQKLTLLYKTGAPHSGSLEDLRHYYRQEFHKNRRRELEMGTTFAGPHKDDVVIAIEEREARYFASEGEQRSCVAALRLSEWQRMKKIGEEQPLMLIDDLGIGLDANRKRRLVKHLNTLGQVFVSATDPLAGFIEGLDHRLIPIVQK